MRRAATLVLVLGTLGALLIAGSSQAQIDHTTDTIKSYTTNQPSLQDADFQNNTGVVCSVNEDWSTWEIHLSTDQGNTWSMADYYNGSASGNFEGDECKVDVGPTGENAIAVFREADRVNVATRLDGASVWERDTESLNFSASITQPYLDTQIRNSSTWIVLAHVGGDWQFYRTDDAGSTYQNKSFAQEFDGEGASMCTVEDGDFQRIYVIGEVNSGGALRAYYTTDGGDTWQAGGIASEGATNFDQVGDSECEASGNFNVYHSFTDDYSNAWEIYESTNGGDDWSNVFYTTSFGRVSQQHVFDSNGTTSLIAQAEGHLVSTTDGSSWTQRSWSGSTGSARDVPFLYTQKDALNGLIAEKSSKLDLLKEKPPKPGVDKSATLFGNSQSVRVSWHETPQVFVRDANGDDRIFKLDAGLAEKKKKEVCKATISEDESGSFWDFFSVGTAEDFELREPGGVAEGLEVTRNSTTNNVHTCRIYESWNDEEWGGMVLRDGSNLGFLDYNTTGTTEAPIGFDGLHANEFVFGLVGDNPDAGSGNWGYIAGDDIYTSGDIFPSTGAGNAVLPVVDNLNDVAADKRQDLQTRLYCAISGDNGTGNGTQCWNQAGGEIAHNTTLKGNSIQVYDHNVWVANGSHIARYKVDTTGGTFTEKASTVVGGEEIRITKDGQYIVDCGSTDLAVLKSSDLSTVTTTETIDAGGGLRLCDVDWSNSYAYTVDDTTVYRVPLFNHTASSDESGPIVGTVNTVDSGGDTQATGDETTTDDGGTATDDVTRSNVTDTTALADSLGINLADANLLMSVITVGIFGGGLALAFGTQMGAKGAVFGAGFGALAGMGLALAYGWMADWVLYLAVLIVSLMIAVEVKAG